MTILHLILLKSRLQITADDKNRIYLVTRLRMFHAEDIMNGCIHA